VRINMQKLSEKDIRTIRMGVIGAGLILVFFCLSKWVDHWKEVRSEIALIKSKLEAIDVEKARQAGLLKIVPVLEMPVAESEQTSLFRDKLRDQFKAARINNNPLQILSTGKKRVGGYKTVRVESGAKCNLGQLLDFLARLNENPYLLGVEEMRIRTDKKQPQNVEVDLTFSTLAK
jgi:hypothetical protein